MKRDLNNNKIEKLQQKLIIYWPNIIFVNNRFWGNVQTTWTNEGAAPKT